VNVVDQAFGKGWASYQGDCVEVLKGLPDASVHLTVSSLPFSNLYTYSDSMNDMGNSADDAEFFAHMDFLIPELHRVTVPGRLCVMHCKDLVNYKGRDGMAGLRDFPGDIVRRFQAHGWAWHSKVTIWTDPVLEMERTKANGLLYKTLRSDASFSRQGMPEYLVIFRRWPKGETDEARVEPVTHTHESFPLDLWQRYASCVWFDIKRTNVLNARIARDSQDDKHLCPLQLDVIERCIDLWTNPGDVVLDPFGGVGSVGVKAVEMGRRAVLAELKDSYWRQGVRFLQDAEALVSRPTLFDLIGAAS